MCSHLVLALSSETVLTAAACLLVCCVHRTPHLVHLSIVHIHDLRASCAHHLAGCLSRTAQVSLHDCRGNTALLHAAEGGLTRGKTALPEDAKFKGKLVNDVYEVVIQEKSSGNLFDRIEVNV